MKELLASLPRTTKNNLVLLDTCFLIDIFHNHKEHELLEQSQKRRLAITSFNAEELVHVVHKVKDNSVKEHVRKFFKEHPEAVQVLEIPVSPGNKDAELRYVQTVDPYLAQDIPDPSDAVLMAAAIKTHSVVLTKDKHHLFTVLLENYVQRWGLRVLKSFNGL